MIHLMTKEKFFEEYLLSQEDLEKLEEATGIDPERARYIWKLVKSVGMDNFSDVHEKIYLEAIYDLGLEPDDEDERKECPDIYLDLKPIEKVYAGYLLAWEQAFEIFNSVDNKP